MTKKFLVLIFFLILFSNVHAEDQKIVYLNVDKIMQQSLAGKSIKQQLKKIYDNNLENFKKNDEILRQKEKKIINQKNILSQEEFEKEISSLRSEIIKFQKEQVKARDNLNKLRVGASNKLIVELSPILKESVSYTHLTLPTKA